MGLLKLLKDAMKNIKNLKENVSKLHIQGPSQQRPQLPQGVGPHLTKARVVEMPSLGGVKVMSLLQFPQGVDPLLTKACMVEMPSFGGVKVYGAEADACFCLPVVV